MSDGKGDVWVEAGFAELARSGVEGVRVEVLAKNLGVTKGGFYRRFADRAALLETMLQRWREGRAASIAQQTRLDGQEPRERLKAVIQLYSERLNPEAMAIEPRDPAMGPLGRERRGGGGRRRRRAAQARRRALSRHRACGRGGRGAGLPVLLLHLRPEPVVRRARPAQAVAAGGEIGREIARLSAKAGALLRPPHRVQAQAAPFSFLVHSL